MELQHRVSLLRLNSVTPYRFHLKFSWEGTEAKGKLLFDQEAGFVCGEMRHDNTKEYGLIARVIRGKRWYVNRLLLYGLILPGFQAPEDNFSPRSIYLKEEPDACFSDISQQFTGSYESHLRPDRRTSLSSDMQRLISSPSPQSPAFPDFRSDLEYRVKDLNERHPRMVSGSFW